MSDKVIRIHAKRTVPSDLAPVVVPERDYSKCTHDGSFFIDEDQRVVWCGRCKTILDPVWCLLQLARDYRRQAWEGGELRRLNAEYRQYEYEKYLRRRDRHRKRHPELVGCEVDGRGVQSLPGEQCHLCWRLASESLRYEPKIERNP